MIGVLNITLKLDTRASHRLHTVTLRFYVLSLFCFLHMCDGEILVLQLFADEQTHLDRQWFPLSSLVIPDIYFTTNVVFDFKGEWWSSLVAICVFSNVKSSNITHFLLQAGNWCRSAASFIPFLILIRISFISDSFCNWVFHVLAGILHEFFYFFLFILRISHFLMSLFIIFSLFLLFSLILALNENGLILFQHLWYFSHYKYSCSIFCLPIFGLSGYIFCSQVITK
jgi:hypothetical protein